MSRVAVTFGATVCHQEGCRPSDDPREPCGCDAIITEDGFGSVVRPRGIGGADIREVAESRYRDQLERDVEPDVFAAIVAHNGIRLRDEDDVYGVMDFAHHVPWRFAETRSDVRLAAIGGAILNLLANGCLVREGKRLVPAVTP